MKHYCIPDGPLPFKEWYSCDLFVRGEPQKVPQISKDTESEVALESSINETVSSSTVNTVCN